MRVNTAELARSITWKSSKQTYFIIRWMVDKGMEDDCFRAYAYFRWVDDIVDVTLQTQEERIAFITHQGFLVEKLYKGELSQNLEPEEQILADLISHDEVEDSLLQSFIRDFMAIMEFDAQRKGSFIDQSELTWYAECLGKAVTDCIQYFIGNHHPYPRSESRHLGAAAAHITHMLRDMLEDIEAGFINIPGKYIDEHALDLDAFNPSDVQAWVQERVELARTYFRECKGYLDNLEVLRCKITGYWYCARFECVLDAIEREGYILRREYNERHKLSTRLKIAWLGIVIAFKHVVGQGLRFVWGSLNSDIAQQAPVSKQYKRG